MNFLFFRFSRFPTSFIPEYRADEKRKSDDRQRRDGGESFLHEGEYEEVRRGRRMKKKRCRCKGSIVMEASLLFPFLILMIAAMILFGFYRHESIVLKSTARRALIMRMQEKEKANGEKIEVPIRYLSISEPEETISKREGKITGRVHFPIMPQAVSYDKSLKDGRFEVRYKVFHTADYARKMRAFLGDEKENEKNSGRGE